MKAEIILRIIMLDLKLDESEADVNPLNALKLIRAKLDSLAAQAALVPELVEWLVMLEGYGHGEDINQFHCPICKAHYDDWSMIPHKGDCRLAQALASARAAMEGQAQEPKEAHDANNIDGQ